MSDPIADLVAIVEGWGGRVHIIKEKTDLPFLPDWVGAPFVGYLLGISYTEKMIVVEKAAIDIAALIHEAAHIFASDFPPDRIENEVFFAGWEYALAAKLGVVDLWLDSMDDYRIGDDRKFSDMDDNQKTNWINDRLVTAEKTGLISPQHEPLSRR